MYRIRKFNMKKSCVNLLSYGMNWYYWHALYDTYEKFRDILYYSLFSKSLKIGYNSFKKQFIVKYTLHINYKL